MIPQRNDNHVEEGLARLTDKYRDKPVISDMLRAGLKGVQRLEDEIWTLLWGWVLQHGSHHATGQQLDDLGAIVKLEREGRDDEDYLLAIRLQIRILRSKGRAEDMVQVSKLIDSLATYVEYYPLGWEVSIYDVPNGADIVRLLTRAKAASSYGVLLTSTWPEADVFAFDNAGDGLHVFESSTSSDPDEAFPCALTTNPPYQRST